MLLPGFLLLLCTKTIFIGLENNLGKYGVVDDNMIHANDKCMALVMVELDVSRSFPAKVDIMWGDQTITQRLDYLNISFSFHYYKKPSHLKNKFPKHLYGSLLSNSKELYVSSKEEWLPISVVDCVPSLYMG